MTDSQKWFSFALVLLIGYLFYILSPVLLPFMVAAVIAYVGTPIVDRLVSWQIPRLLAVIFVFLLLFGILLGLMVLIVPVIEQQVSQFINKLPQYINKLNTEILPALTAKLGMEPFNFADIDLQNTLRKSWQEAGQSIANVLGIVGQSGAALIGLVVTLALIPLLSFYFLRDWPKLLSRIHSLIPRYQEKTFVRLAKESDAVLGAFLRGQLSVMLTLGIVYSVGLSLVGLDLAFLVGFLAGLISFVPYLGFILGLLMATLLFLMQSPEPIQMLYVLGVFGFGQLLESFILTPLLLGGKIGLHPVAVIFAVLAGGQLFGFTGVLLALPVAAVIVVLLRYLQEKYVDSGYYKDSQTSPGE